MRKTSIVLLLVFLSLVLISGSAFAISGACVNCHTMHNSQNGAKMADQDQPYSYLLRASCIGCHSGPVVPATDRQNSYGAPVVLDTVDPGGQGGTKTLAGGDFWWVKNAATAPDSKGHNVSGIANQDGALALKPPGWDPAATPGALADGQINGGAANWTSQLNCAGKFGCHGNHTSDTNDGGILGAHHSNTGGTSTKAENPTTVAGSYRFLGGINGLEHSAWNYNESNANHNEYFGVNGNANYANKRTINYSCAECHGVFHKDIGTASPWLRHPTDVDLPAAGEYASYNPDGTPPGSYSVEAPVARPTVYAASSATVTPGTDIVMCLSCHRAHGSPQPDILRWDYSTMQAGQGTSDTGCFTCHTKKNVD